MAPPTPAAHDSILSSTSQGSQPNQPSAGLSANLTAADLSNLGISGLDQNQIMSLFRTFPVLAKLTEGQGNPKEDAAQTLSNLAQAPYAQQLPVHYQPATSGGGLPSINDPGPSSHPRGPPNLGQLSAVAMQAAPVQPQPLQQGQQPPGRSEDGAPGGNLAQNAPGASAEDPTTSNQATPTSASGGRRGANRAAIGTDEWTRQRKDNHKEVERRRRGNINEGINELGRIVPSGSGEKAKGAILARAVQYIHHLKENEARNIEKWTLEKLLMDQAMGDLQAQLEEVKRMWEEERMARTRLDAELEALKNMNASAGAASKEESSAAGKKRNAEGQEVSAETGVEAEKTGKRPRLD